MNGKCLALAAAVCVLAIPGALAQKAAPAEAGPAAAGVPPAAAKQWPVLPWQKPATTADAATSWSAQDIELARARCVALLKGLNVVTVPEEPIREGPECGTPAPVKLISIGKSPQVALSPPPTVTCDMVAALYRWLERDVQPMARKHLGAPVIRIETMSSYSCRNAYGRTGSRLSEHGKANALDIASFITAGGQTAVVVADWGPTARQIAAQAAAAKVEAEKGQAETLIAPSPTQQARNIPVQRPAAAEAAGGPGMAISIPGVTVLIPPQGSNSQMGLAPPSRLGGPKPAKQPAQIADPGARMDFLRATHNSACKLFNTVLGPEANNAHHNHFHIDLAERIKNTKICE